MTNWNEADHPRDEQGKFTDKGGGSSKTRESYEDKMKRRAEILFPNTNDKKIGNSKIEDRNIGLGNFNNENINREDILYTTMNNKKDNKIYITDNENQKTYLSEVVDNSVFSNDSREKARKFIQKEEGFRDKAYKDIAGIWTIGYGRTENVKPGDEISKEEAEKLFSKDFDRYKKSLNEVKVPLSDNEKIALASFIYNVGQGAFKNSTLLKKLNEGDKKGAANEFDKWIYSKGKESDGLKNRRKREKELFLTPDNY